MLFKGPSGYGRIMNIIMNIIIGIILSLCVLNFVQNIPGNEMLPIFTLLGFFVSFVLGYCVGYAVADVLPAVLWGQKLAALLPTDNKIVKHFVSTAVVAALYVTIISFICLWINNIQSLGLDATIGTWLALLPQLLGFGYIVLLITLPLFMKVATAISGFDPWASASAPASSERPQNL